MKTVLLLAGTAEAREFANAYKGQRTRLVASLAGVTTKPLAYPCETRNGGFGGGEGLRDYLVREGVAAVIDATHPFATGMSRNAIYACDTLGTSLLALVRPAWEPVGNWHGFGSLDEAVSALPPGARVLATTGRKHIDPLTARSDLTVFLRSVDQLDDLPAHIVPIAARGPFTMNAETALMRQQRITHLLTRNAGGESRARLDAAVVLGLPIHIIERPPHLAATVVHSVADAHQWLDYVLRD